MSHCRRHLCQPPGGTCPPSGPCSPHPSRHRRGCGSREGTPRSANLHFPGSFAGTRWGLAVRQLGEKTQPDSCLRSVLPGTVTAWCSPPRTLCSVFPRTGAAPGRSAGLCPGGLHPQALTQSLHGGTCSQSSFTPPICSQAWLSVSTAGHFW